jgi:hypothetical protein
MTEPFITQSQVGQDAWARGLIGENGTFLDIGANHPIVRSNTFALEQLGWTGVLVDNDAHCCYLCRAERKSTVLEGDSTRFDWTALPQKEFDYLSLDVDAATLDTLRSLLTSGVKFRCATIEHDSYRFGPGPRDAMRKLLTVAGYVLARPDVEHQGAAFEDWWITPELGAVSCPA